jgi:transcriptional regulator with GAF, ATPase, and Fis domain
MEALRYVWDEAEGSTDSARVEVGSVADLADVIREASPCSVYVVPVEVIGELRAAEGFVDAKTKERDRQLSHYLLGKNGIPVLDSPFKVPGKIPAAIGSLLTNAQEKGERKTYVLGVSVAAIDELAEDIPRSTVGPSIEARHEALLKRMEESLSEDAQKKLEQVKGRFAGESFEARMARTSFLIAARCTHPVLLVGETGTGKEIGAEIIHKYSMRSSLDMVVVNCAAIPVDMLESELFGSVKGSATGLETRIGCWQKANNSTLFLDEIGELRPQHQAAILRAMDSNKVRKVGDTAETTVDVRVIAATNEDLVAAVAQGRFREDLLFRLAHLVIRTPPLRRQSSEIPALARQFWLPISREPLPEDLLELFRAYHWPGNYREMKMLLRRIASYLAGGPIRTCDVLTLLGLSGHPLGAREPHAAPAAQLARMAALMRGQEALDHLRTVQVALRALAEGDGEDGGAVMSAQAVLLHRLDAVEKLCRKPRQFGSAEVYGAVDGVAGQLRLFLETLETDHRAALDYWRREMVGDLTAALSLLGRETRRLQESQ